MIAYKAAATVSVLVMALTAPAMAQTASSQAASFRANNNAPGRNQSDFARMRQDEVDRGSNGQGKDKGKGHSSHGNGNGYGHGNGHCDDADGCHASPG